MTTEAISWRPSPGCCRGCSHDDVIRSSSVVGSCRTSPDSVSGMVTSADAGTCLHHVTLGCLKPWLSPHLWKTSGGGRGRSCQNVFLETSGDAPHQQGAVDQLHQCLVSSSDFSSESPPGVCVSLPSHTKLLLSLMLDINIPVIKLGSQSEEQEGWDYHGNIWGALMERICF